MVALFLNGCIPLKKPLTTEEPLKAKLIGKDVNYITGAYGAPASSQDIGNNQFLKYSTGGICMYELGCSSRNETLYCFMEVSVDKGTQKVVKVTVDGSYSGSEYAKDYYRPYMSTMCINAFYALAGI